MTEDDGGSLMDGLYYVYIMSSATRTIYTGVTNNLERRVLEHKRHLIKGFTAKYDVTRLVYYETHRDITEAIAREKQIKGWVRRKKVELIATDNPQWRDLSDGWFVFRGDTVFLGNEDATRGDSSLAGRGRPGSE